MAEPSQSASKDLYELLQVSPRASQKVIQAAYRALVRDSHPDVNATFEAGPRIRELNAAYRVLGNTDSRARYDLECSRARRNRRARSLDRGPIHPIAEPVGRMRVLTPAPPERRATERRPMLSGGAVLVLMTVAALTALVLVLVWVSLDPTRDDLPSFDRSLVEWSGR